MANNTFHVDPERYSEANKDYFRRIQDYGLNAIYDATLDTLFIEIGEPREALTEHVMDNIMIRIDPDTLEVVGFEVLDFLEDFVPEHRMVRDAIHDWGLTKDADTHISLMEPRYAPSREIVESLIAQLTHRVG